ncbi:MAG: flagellar hook-associated protein FlgK [Caulobacterales bacterium]|nr:flagellar hook-associated protein FlgK [Caulobacterales bacterium]
MSLAAIMATATTGLNAAQASLRVVSDNIANVNTPGYVRKQAVQTSLVSQGMGVGVDISSIKRAANAYLQGASLIAAADASRAGALYEGLDAAQRLFGDPSETGSFFDKLEDVWASFSAASDDPSSTLARGNSINTLQTFLQESDRISRGLTSLGVTTDTKINADISQVNDLLSRIQSLNTDIQRATLQGGDPTGSENLQSNLVDELSSLMNIKIDQRAQGGVNIRSAEGYALAGDGAATLSFNKTSGAEGYITASLPLGSGQPVRLNITTGDLKGLLELRNTELPAMAAQLGEFTAQAAEEINRASNASTAVPAPASLTGRNTGLDATEAFANFTGKTNIVVTNASGVVQRRVLVDFDAQTMSLDGGATTTSFASPATFLSVLNSANGLGAAGSASFTNGVLSVSATGGNGVSVVDDATTPSDKAGKGFSHFFGLNDLVRSTGMSTYATGMTPSSLHGFTSGSISLRLMGPDGTRLKDITVTPTPGDDMQDLLNQLNATTSGVGAYGAFSLDADGELKFAASGNSGVSLSLISDDTQRGAGGPSMSQLFGIGPAERGARAQRFSIDANVLSKPGLLPFAQVDLSVSPPAASLKAGDGRGALAIAKAGEVATKFAATGGLAATTTTLSNFAMQMSGDIARKAANAESRKDAAEAVQTEADSQRQSAEGVNLDEELINMTTYQQAYNASARLIQAAKDMYDVLTNMI